MDKWMMSLVLAACVGGAFAAPPLAMRPAKRLPNADGVIGATEYDEGIRFCGLKLVPSDRLAPAGESTVTLLSDARTLWVAGRLKARNVDHDGGLGGDDVMEVILSGDAPERVAKIAVNPFGKVRETSLSTAAKTVPQWKCDGLKVGTKVNRGWWELELAIPLKSVGTFKTGFKVNVGRRGPGLPAMSLTGAPMGNGDPRLEFVWSETAAAIQVDRLGDPENGDWRPRLKVTSAADRQSGVRADFYLGRPYVGGSWEPLRLESRLIKSGECFEPVFETRDRRDFRLELAVRDAERGTWLYRQELVARRTPRGGDIPVTLDKDLPGLGELQVFHYPGYGRARVNVYPASGLDLNTVAVRIGDRTTRLVSDGKRFSALATVPAESGEHPLVVAALKADGEKLRFPAVGRLVTRQWEWQGHTLGLDRVILPPFKPLVVNGSQVAVIHRQYDFGAAGLPKSVVALGRELLSAPIRFEGCAEGRELQFVGREVRVSAAADGYEGRVEGSAEAAGIRVSAVSRLEYDGFMYGTYALSGVTGKTLERLTLVVPLKDSEVPLMHIAMADSIRANPTGRVPPGNGVVWNGKQLVRNASQDWNSYAPESVPYVWLGAERRGWCWFTDNTCGMELDPRREAVRLRRTNGTLQLEIDLVNHPTRLEDGHQFTFGFEATPVKTADRALWRQFQTGELGAPEGMVPRLVMDSIGLGFWNGWARRPYGGDWRLFASAVRHVTEADDPAEYLRLSDESIARDDERLKAYCQNLPKIGTTPHYDWFRSCRSVSRKTIGNSRTRSVPLKYSDPTLCWSEEEEERYFQSEWVSRGNGYTAASRNFLTRSYMDFSLYHYHKEIQLGMTGVYLDDMFPMTCRNPDICGRHDASGRFHGDFGILAMRELVKRIAVIQHQAGCKPRLLQVHMTNCLLVPAFAFATSQLAWEDHYGETEFQTRFKDDYVRAESLGGQLGAEAVALDGIKPRQSNWQSPEWDARFRFLTRTQQAMLLPAGVKTWLRPPWPPKSGVHREELFAIMSEPGKFGAWEPDTEFVPYYEYDGSLGTLPEGLHVGCWRRQGKSLYVLGNQTDRDLTLRLSDKSLVVPAYDLRFYLK